MSLQEPVNLIAEAEPMGISGGHLYNRKMIEGLIDAGVQCEIVNVDQMDELNGILIVDNLLAQEFLNGWLQKDRREQFSHIVCLSHLPLSITPGLSVEARKQKREFDRALYELCSIVIAPSRFGVEQVKNIATQVQTLVAYPASDLVPTHTASQKDTIVSFICVGNILIGKGQRELVEIFKRVNNPNWKLVFVASRCGSDADTLKRLEQDIREHGFTQRIRIAWDLSREEIAQQLANADVFVSATHFETFGMALLEAQMAGLPTIVNDVGGVRESTNATSTLYVESKDEWVTTIKELLDQPTKLQQMQKAARLPKPNFSWNHTSEQILGCLRCLA